MLCTLIFYIQVCIENHSIHARIRILFDSLEERNNDEKKMFYFSIHSIHLKRAQ